ncbi:MAG: ThuA domain-containing protein [Caulobacterales bacterium]|nr:ThuA domain-containing protein [Caulobacterales bacterium]
MNTKAKLAIGAGVATLLAAGLAVAQVPQNIPEYNKIGPGGAIPPPMPPGGGALPGYRQQSVIDGVQKKTPEFEDVFNVLDAIDSLPVTAKAKPKKARKLLIYSTARGYGHSSIPITAFAITELGKATGAWTADTSFSQADFTAENLAKYDVLVLNNTTGAFLDDANDAAGTAARRKALLDFVRGGKGLVLTHAGGDTYHGTGVPRPPPGSPPPTGPQPPQKSLWPEFTKMVGGYFKFHWYYPQPVTVKIDDPKSPINAPFNGRPFKIHDEIYTFSNDSYSRKNVHVLTSVDYSKMSAEDKAKENPATKRTDGDYALSWIRREGQGRVYYSVLGHSEHIYFIPNILQSITNGIQYAAGDLAADDSPSEK